MGGEVGWRVCGAFATMASPAPNAPSAAPGAAEPQPATPAQMAAIRRLIQVIARLFYDDGHILLIDQLVSVVV